MAENYQNACTDTQECIDSARVAQLIENLEALRVPAEVELELAVKTQSAQTIVAAAAALEQLGRPVLLGHNRVQEAVATIPPLRNTFPDARVAMIGPLQSNKINACLRHCNEIETVASVDLVTAIAKRVDLDAGGMARRVPKLWVQVNVSGEDTKSGVTVAAAPALVAACAQAGLPAHGLMTIGLHSEDEAAVASGYRVLTRLRDELRCDFPELTGLSMGMSNDYQLAIACGATRVRIGSSVFGARL